MNAERFDDLTRLWILAPTRRVFLLQVGTTLAIGALGRVGIRIPRWLWAKDLNLQCLPGYGYREGMRCGGGQQLCGICMDGKCVAAVHSACRGKDPCKRCDPATLTCTDCPKGQECCKDGCCDGKCVNDACCPPDKVCGQNKELCCRDCEECKDNVCVKQPPPAECPEETHELTKDGCCTCRGRVCGGKCCGDNPCVEGRCCKECGQDGAVCCDGRQCCRERCVDPEAAKKCCECYEDITPEEAKEVLERAKKWQKYQRDNKTPYVQDTKQDPREETPAYMDCSFFVQKALGVEVVGHMFNRTITKRVDGKLQQVPAPERLSTLLLDGNCYFRRLPPGEAPRAGDLVAQPRASGPPGSLHVGVATGVSKSQNLHRGIAMGGTKDAGSAAESDWGSESTQNPNGDRFRSYRPQKCKKGCKCP